MNTPVTPIQAFPRTARRTDKALRQLAVIGSLAVAATCHGALWESQNWALTGGAGETAGYDSNLTFSRDGAGDGFETTAGDLLLERLHSPFMADLAASAGQTEFLSNRAPSQLDGSASVGLQYPGSTEILPLFSADAAWTRTTAADLELNRRLRLDKTSADVGGRVVTSGKLGLDAGVGYALYDYSSDGLGRNEQTEIKLGPAYDLSPLTEISADVEGGSGTSTGTGPGNATVRDRSGSAILQVRGQILPKLTSTVYAGVTHVDYSGGFSGSSSLPTSGGELVWALSPGRSLGAGVGLGNGFAPDGEIQRTQRVTVDYQQAIGELWSVDLLVLPTRYSDHSESFVRTDTSVSAGITAEYHPSPRFSLILGCSALHQTSNVYEAGFTRSLVSIQAKIHL